MNTLNRLVQYLESRRIPFRLDHHPLTFTAKETAKADHIPLHTMAKVVVVHSELGYAAAVVPCDMVLNLRELRDALGTRTLRLAEEEELIKLFPNTELGAMPPFGNGTLFDIPVYVDPELTTQEFLAFNAGTHTDVIRVRADDFRRLVRPQVIEIGRVPA
ncbi:MAG: YbaK/EbsC family protein [Bryobacteraceae bacterium]|nr:YbaK/EbsC family protein [Bryobacteraceae bacterium]